MKTSLYLIAFVSLLQSCIPQCGCSPVEPGGQVYLYVTRPSGESWLDSSFVDYIDVMDIRYSQRINGRYETLQDSNSLNNYFYSVEDVNGVPFLLFSMYEAGSYRLQWNDSVYTDFKVSFPEIGGNTEYSSEVMIDGIDLTSRFNTYEIVIE